MARLLRHDERGGVRVEGLHGLHHAHGHRALRIQDDVHVTLAAGARQRRAAGGGGRAGAGAGLQGQG